MILPNTMTGRILSALFFLLAASTPLLAEVTGVVYDPRQRPIAEVIVTDLSDGLVVVTDAEGRFALPDGESPRQIEVAHQSFEVATFTVENGSHHAITLEPRRIREDITVTARTPAVGFSPVGAAATEVRIGDLPTPPSTLLNMVEAIPGVAENGQGGIFQVYSVRGVSRQRVLTQVAGMRITSPRRAGASASFLDPLLLEGADVLRGPASSYYGSGSLGGVVRMDPARFQGPVSEIGYDTRGHENYQMAGWGDENWSLGAVRRDAGNPSDPLGFEINSHFTQYSAVLRRSWQRDSHLFSLVVIPALGRDIGKGSTDFPDQSTIYPQENHLLVQFSAEDAGRWRLKGWIHPHELHTRDLEAERQADVFNDTFDFGADFSHDRPLGAATNLRLGIDYFGRRSVDAFEFQSARADGRVLSEFQSLDGAEEDELGLLASLRHDFGLLKIEGGGRFSWYNQQNGDAAAISQSAGNGFFGATIEAGSGIEINGSIGSGLRFPSLTERFFSGTTGRGEVIGNPNLESERSLSLEAGIRWFGRSAFISAYTFRNAIDDYVERIEAAPELLTFVNLTSGTIRGFEFETVVTPAEDLQLYWRGHIIAGTDGVDGQLADIPTNRFTLGTRFESQRWQYGGQWQYRDGKTRVGSGEKPIPSAHLVSLYGGVKLRPEWTLIASLDNLLNEQYFNSADRKVPLAVERSFSIRLRWSPGG